MIEHGALMRDEATLSAISEAEGVADDSSDAAMAADAGSWDVPCAGDAAGAVGAVGVVGVVGAGGDDDDGVGGVVAVGLVVAVA